MYRPERSIAVWLILWRTWLTLLSVMLNLSATVWVGSSFAVLHRNAKICFAGGIGALPDKLPIGLLPVVMTSWANSSKVCLVIRKWLLNSSGKYDGTVVSKKLGTRFKSRLMKQHATLKWITSSLSSKNSSTLISLSSNNSKANKTGIESAIFCFSCVCIWRESNARWLGSGLCNRNVPFHWTRRISEISNRNFCWMESATRVFDMLVFRTHISVIHLPSSYH